MTCPYCREAVPDGARYCPACGRDVSPGEAPTVLVEDMTRLGIPAGTPPSRPGSRPGSNPSSPSLSRTSVDFGAALSGALFSAAVYGLLYLAIEPLSPKGSLMSLQIGSVAPDFEAKPPKAR